MINYKNIVTLITLGTFAVCGSVIATEEQSCSAPTEAKAVLSKTEKKVLKLVSPKKQKKVLDKFKSQFTADKANEIAAQIADSTLTDSQKVALIEALDKAQTELKNQVSAE